MLSSEDQNRDEKKAMNIDRMVNNLEANGLFETVMVPPRNLFVIVYYPEE